jgi:hypothetical protein
MSRRPSLPGAAELFRSTGGTGEAPAPAPAPAPPAAAPEGRRSPERVARLGVPREEAEPAGDDDGVDPPGERGASVRSLPAAGSGIAGAKQSGGSAEGVSDFDGPPADYRGLRAPAPYEDEFAEPASRRSAGRIRQTRRQSRRSAADRRPSGRERHEEKITVYCSAEELFELERARLSLRGDHGLVVDRGRIVREAVAVVLADLDAKGDSSILVRRLRES